MKLEFKNLAAYLHFKPICYANASNYGLNKPLEKEMDVYMMLNLISGNTNFKLALRPLSDLTKEIEVNGEKFVPSEKLAFHLFDYDFLAMVIDRKNTNGIPFWAIQKLLEWHFDIFGLIENNLAIDANTLNQTK